MKNYLMHIFCYFFFCLGVSNSYAHGGNEKRSSISASTHVYYSNRNAIDSNQIWQIPGAFMGGEAYPAEKGLNLQDIELQGTWVIKPEYSVDAKIASHHDGDIELESFWFSFYPKDKLLITLGKVDARFSPSASWHAYNTSFNEAPMNAEIFFGGHFTDQGLQSIYQSNSFTLGFEAWNGNAWPASPGEYSSDIFLHYNTHRNALKLFAGIWTLYSEALNRSDERYSQGHNHGNSLLITTPDIFFSGRNILSGAFFELSYELASNQTLGFYSELIQQEISGNINDATRASAINSKHYGFINSLAYDINTLRLALRHEVMSFENRFNGASANFIAADANLINDNFEPSRTHLSISKLIDNFIIRAEAISDKSISEDGLNRFSLAFIWNDQLWVEKSSIP